LERYTGFAREIGWARLAGEERQTRTTVDAAAVRAELVLLEQEANGPIGPDENRLRSALGEILGGSPLASPVANPSGTGTAPGMAWRWNWRRTAALGAVLALAGILTTAVYGQSSWRIWAAFACGWALLALGPWVDADRIGGGAELWRRGGAWLRGHTTMLALDREIRRRKDEILAAAARHSKADQWVNERLAVVCHRYETERSRAELASRAVRSQPGPDTGLAPVGRRAA
jgi:hypothetical protein